MAEIDRLTVVWDARFDRLEEKLNKVVRSTYGSADKIEKRLGAINDNVARRLGASSDNVRRALGNATTATLQELAPGADRYATALSNLGKAGLAAGFGIAALVGAAQQARAAIAFGDEIGDAAQRIGVTTDTLQEFRFAISQTGGDAADADEALSSFTQTLGRAQTLGGKSLKAFKALGLDPKEIGEADEALKVVLDRLSRIESESQRQGLAKALGLEKFIPLAREGTAKIDELREAAHKLGFVMSADLIARAGEAQDKLDALSQVVKVQLASAFVDMAPVILAAAQALADAARAVNTIAQAINEARPYLEKWIGLLSKANEVASLFNPFGQAKHVVDQVSKLLPNRKAADDQAILAQKANNKTKPPPFSVVDVSGGGGGGSRAARTPRDTTIQRTAEVERALQSAERDLLQAWQALVVNADARRGLATNLLALETEVRNAELDRQIADIQADDGLTKATKARLTKNLEIVRLEEGKVDALKQELVERDFVEAKAAEGLKLRSAELDAQAEVLQLAEGLARTAADRREIELRLLDLADQRERAEEEAVLASKTSTDAEKEIARRKLAQLEATRGAREAGVLKGTQGPLESFFDTLPKDVDDVNERMQALAADGIGSVVDGLADAVTGARSLKDVFRSVIAQMLADITRLNLQAALSRVFGNFSGGFGGGGGFGNFLSNFFGGAGGFNFTAPSGTPQFFADGTDYARGGLSVVGERGPELLNVPRGSQVIPNDVLRGLSSGVFRRPSGNPATTNHWSPSWNVSVNGAMSERDARRTGAQMGAAALREMALARKRGFN